MRRILPLVAMACLFMASCKKETSLTSDSKSNLNAGPEANQNANAGSGQNLNGAVNFQTQQVFEEPGAFWNDCTQEMMNYQGNVHILVHGVINSNKLTTTEHVNYQNLVAVGQNSNITYRGSVVQNNSTNSSIADGKYTNSGSLTIKFVSPGGQNNFVQKFTYHITVNAQGKTSSEVDSANYGTCQ